MGGAGRALSHEAVGARIVFESERVRRPPRSGIVAAVVHPAARSYRVLWDDGHTSIVIPAAGCTRIDPASRPADDADAFRLINDRIRDLEQAQPGMREFVCECADGRCTEAVQLTDAEYDLVRAPGGQFALVPGHEHPQESVLSRTGRFVVVTRTDERS
jgi:hypothetical protein